MWQQPESNDIHKADARACTFTFKAMCSLSNGSSPRHTSCNGLILWPPPLVELDRGLRWLLASSARQVPVREGPLLRQESEFSSLATSAARLAMRLAEAGPSKTSVLILFNLAEPTRLIIGDEAGCDRPPLVGEHSRPGSENEAPLAAALAAAASTAVSE